MTEDATLSSFQRSETDSDDAEEPADTSSEAESEPDHEASSDTNGDVEPATSTYVWGTYTCDDCEETVARAWREGEQLICPACKDW